MSETINNKVLFGIDYGSKLSGNTVIAALEGKEIFFLDVEKGIDADQFILNACDHFKPAMVFIDAPLSLPGVYGKINGFKDYHFRQADIELKAMSPMFLGGLVARAIELTNELEEMGSEVKETYPRILANDYKLKNKGYKGSRMALKDCTKVVLQRLDEALVVDKDDITSWHHLDALLALVSALRHKQGESCAYGDEEEGQIII